MKTNEASSRLADAVKTADELAKRISIEDGERLKALATLSARVNVLEEVSRRPLAPRPGENRAARRRRQKLERRQAAELAKVRP